MTGDIPDLEKQAPKETPHHDTDTETPHQDVSSSALTDSPLAKETHPDSHSDSRSSIDTNPLYPLEHALAKPLSHADIEIEPASSPDEDDDEDENSPPPALANTATRTSITSSASRPPDFEVTLDANDPENPRNW
jgi:hypothetical protein